MEKIIQSILDTDLYKLTMQQAVLELYPKDYAKYQFILRDPVKLPDGFKDALEKEIQKMAYLKLGEKERRFLREKCPYFTKHYLDFLASYRFDPFEVAVSQENDELRITVSGLWVRTILWEVPLMAVISELFFKLNGQDQEVYSLEKRQEINLAKAELFRENALYFADFATRRRYSFENHRRVVTDMKEAGEFFRGTSNVYLAFAMGLTPIGTQAHEWFQAHGAMYGFTSANKKAMELWVKVYGKNLSIALTDTFGSDAFFDSFDEELANIYSGIRQDSGDPIALLEKSLEHYKKLGIDPKTKTLVFSDSLTPELAVAIHRACGGRINDIYGIGTNLGNDVGVKPLNMVIKMVAYKPADAADWIPTVKLSDVPGKHTGELEAIERCKLELGILV